MRAPAIIYHHGTRQHVSAGDYRITADRYSGRRHRYFIILRPGQTHAILGDDPQIAKVGRCRLRG